MGRVTGAWGLRGHLKVEPMTDFGDRFTVGRTLILRGTGRRIVEVKEHKRQLLVRFRGIDTPEEAAAFGGALLTIPENELAPLSEDQFYRFQLIGLAVENERGANIGSVADILETGETQVLVVKGDAGEHLIPLVDGFVSEVDLDRSTIRADLTNLQ